MKKLISNIVLIAVIITGALLAACGGQTSSTATNTTNSPTTTTTTTVPTSTSTATGTTAGELAVAGKTVYANRCAKCHGDQGQGITGPVLIGASNTLDKYNSAQGLLDFIDSAMPLDAPGSLSPQDYLSIVAFLLVQNNFVAASTTLAEGQLQNVALK